MRPALDGDRLLDLRHACASIRDAVYFDEAVPADTHPAEHAAWLTRYGRPELLHTMRDERRRQCFTGPGVQCLAVELDRNGVGHGRSVRASGSVKQTVRLKATAPAGCSRQVRPRSHCSAATARKRSYQRPFPDAADQRLDSRWQSARSVPCPPRPDTVRSHATLPAVEARRVRERHHRMLGH